MRDLTGYLLKKKRLEHGLQQKDLCRGICSASYLCKLEQGDASPGEDVLRLLFARLGVDQWHSEEGTDADRALLRRYFTATLTGTDPAAAAEAVTARLPAFAGTELEQLTPLFQAYEAIQVRDFAETEARLAQVQPFRPWLSAAGELLLSHACICCDRVYSQEDETRTLRAEERYPCSVSALDMATLYFVRGDYQRALNGCRTGFDRAVREGCVPLMAQAALTECNCYANLGELTLMLAAAERAMGLFAGNEAEQGNISYNLGATLMEFGRDREALTYLLRAYEAASVSPSERGLICHKLALLLPRLHRGDEAARYLHEAEAQLSPGSDPLRDRMLHIAALRLNKGYLDDASYGEALQAFCRDAAGKLPHGYVQFHERMLEEYLVHTRRYKEAYLLVKKREGLRQKQE